MKEKKLSCTCRETLEKTKEIITERMRFEGFVVLAVQDFESPRLSIIRLVYPSQTWAETLASSNDVRCNIILKELSSNKTLVEFGIKNKSLTSKIVKLARSTSTELRTA